MALDDDNHLSKKAAAVLFKERCQQPKISEKKKMKMARTRPDKNFPDSSSLPGDTGFQNYISHIKLNWAAAARGGGGSFMQRAKKLKPILTDFQ